MRIYRLAPDGRKWGPALDRGDFVLGDPKLGSRKHVAESAVRVRSEDEAIALLRKGLLDQSGNTDPAIARQAQPLCGRQAAVLRQRAALAEESRQTPAQPRLVLQSAFPQHKRPPALLLELADVRSVARAVAGDFR